MRMKQDHLETVKKRLHPSHTLNPQQLSHLVNSFLSLGLSLLICKLRGVPALLSLRTLRTQKISLFIGELFLEDKSLKG